MKDITKQLKSNISISPMVSSRGNAVPNQYIIRSAHGRLFKSYQSNIAFCPNDEPGTVYLGPDWDCSKTTMKYLNWFLNGQSAAETREKLASGQYKLQPNL